MRQLTEDVVGDKEQTISIPLRRLVGLEINFRQGQYGVVQGLLTSLVLSKPYGDKSEAFGKGRDDAATLAYQVKNLSHVAELTNNAPFNASILIVHLQEVADIIQAHLKQTGNSQSEEARERFYELCRQAIEDATDG